ncbi:hypothetical protein OH77DRAFT_362334 [Trametes cingulata]|nr:hypothetical protein OH77DRAFT_362334 [Trametes cingulata]
MCIGCAWSSSILTWCYMRPACEAYGILTDTLLCALLRKREELHGTITSASHSWRFPDWPWTKINDNHTSAIACEAVQPVASQSMAIFSVLCRERSCFSFSCPCQITGIHGSVLDTDSIFGTWQGQYPRLPCHSIYKGSGVPFLPLACD